MIADTFDGIGIGPLLLEFIVYEWNERIQTLTNKEVAKNAFIFSVLEVTIREEQVLTCKLMKGTDMRNQSQLLSSKLLYNPTIANGYY